MTAFPHGPNRRFLPLTLLLLTVAAALVFSLFSTDGRTWSLVGNTLLLCGATCAVSLPVGTMLAVVIVRTDMPGRRTGALLLAVLLVMPLYLQAAAWQAGFGTQGWCTLAWHTPAWVDGWSGAIWVHAAAALPWVVLITGAGLWLTDPEPEEQALLDASAPRVFARVTLPSMLPAIGLAGLWVAVTTAGEMTVTDLFGVRTYAEELYTRWAVGETGEAAGMGGFPGLIATVAPLAVAVVLCLGVMRRGRPAGGRRPWCFRLGRYGRATMVATAAVLLLLAALPLANLLFKAGVLVEQTPAGRERTWSVVKCLDTVASSPWQYRRELGWSAGIGVLAASAAVACAVPLGWLARRGRWWTAPAVLTASVALALPGTVVGLAVIRLLNRPEIPRLVDLYDRSILAPWMALTFRALPVAVLIVWHGLRSVDDELLHAASVDGAGPLGRLFRVALPARRSTLMVAWAAAFVVALGDLSASHLTVPPGVTTVAIRIFLLLHSGVEHEVAGICLVLIGLLAIGPLAVVVLGQRWLKSRQRHTAIG